MTKADRKIVDEFWEMHKQGRFATLITDARKWVRRVVKGEEK